jgi:redox-sensing transcriptional repressor
MAKPSEIPEPAIRRLSLYLRQLEHYIGSNRKTISSKQLGKDLALTDAQVRKDLAYFGQFGHPGIGYRIDELIIRVRQILGTDKTWNVALVGAGNLGRALASYRGFDKKGFRLAAVFDCDQSKVGKMAGQYSDLIVQPLSELKSTVKTLSIRLGMLTVPGEAAQKVVDQLLAAGVRGILNFAPIQIQTPDDTAAVSVDLATHLEQLSFRIENRQH